MADHPTGRCPKCGHDFEGCTCTGGAVRRVWLAMAIRREPGPWTTRRVMRLYRAAGIAPGRRTAAKDLVVLARRGHLVRAEQPGHRYYTRKDTR